MEGGMSFETSFSRDLWTEGSIDIDSFTPDIPTSGWEEQSTLGESHKQLFEIERNFKRFERSVDHLIASQPDAAEQAWDALQSILHQRKVRFGDGPLPVSLKPHLVSARRHEVWHRHTEQLMLALDQVGRNVIRHPDIYRLLRLPPEARELIDIDPGYERMAIISRPDMVWEGDRLSLFEVNSDSPAMMTFTDELEQEALRLFPINSAEGARFVRFDRTHTLLRGMLDVYREWGGTKRCPRIAIVDWAGQKTRFEQEATARTFTSLGCQAFTCDPRDLTVESGRLFAKGRRIDIVYRRVLFPDFVRRAEELAPLIRAYREGMVCMINPLRSYVLGNKMLLGLLALEEVLEGLSERQRHVLAKMVLPTRVMELADVDQLIREKNGWVLKGAFGHGGNEVVLGPEVSEDEWSYAVNDMAWTPAVAQAYTTPPRLRQPMPNRGHWEFEEAHANWNPFIFNGVFAGAMTRVSANLKVSITARGALLPCLPVIWWE
mgnify:CR=1 FL=1